MSRPTGAGNVRKGASVRLRLLAVSIVALLFALAQTVLGGASFIGDASVHAASIDSQRPASTVLQEEDEDEDDDDDDDDSEDDDEDDDDDSEDDDEDDDDDSEDDEEDDDDSEDDAEDDDDNVDDDLADDEDNVEDDDDSAAAVQAIDDESLKQPLQQASGTSTRSGNSTSRNSTIVSAIRNGITPLTTSDIETLATPQTTLSTMPTGGAPALRGGASRALHDRIAAEHLHVAARSP